MKKIIIAIGAIVSFAACASAWGEQSEKELQTLASKGDYQARRNLAYSYAVGWKDIQKDPVKACAWYRVILMSDSSKVDAGDVGNEWVYCRKLDLIDSGKAWALARNLK